MKAGSYAGAMVLLAFALSGMLRIAAGVAQTNEPVSIERDFTVRIWRKEHGLPDDRVLSLLSDRNGFLWIGTRKGVSRFDGRNFKTWSRSSHAAFTSEECLELAEDRDGVIWVGTLDGVIELGDPVKHHQIGSLAYSNQPVSVPYEGKITDLLVTPENELMVTATGGLVCRTAAGEWRRPWRSPEGLFALAQTPDGSVWVGFALRQFPASNPALVGNTISGEVTNLELSCVHALAVTSEGSLYATVGRWVGNFGYLYRLTPGGWQEVSDDLIRNPADPCFLFADANGGLWHSLENGELVRRKGEQRTLYRLPASLREHAPLSMAQDHEGNLWLGMARDGLVCLQPRTIQLVTTEAGLKDNNVWTLIQARSGVLWVGSDSGVTGFEPTPGGGFAITESLDLKDVRALAEDREGRIWIGTRSGLHVKSGPDLAELRFSGEWFNSKIRALHTSRDGSVWVATALGLHRIGYGQTNSWRAPKRLPHNDVRVVLEDRAGSIWVGTDGGGLARLTESGFERFDEVKGLSSLRVWALHEDSDGVLWIGTDRGLGCMRNGLIHALTTEQGLPANLVNGIAEDTHGNLWIGHDLGIYRVAREQLLQVMNGYRKSAACVSFDEDDGLPGLETNGQISYPSAIALRDGRLAFATVAGVALLDPKRPPDLTNPPPAHVESLLASGQTLFSGRPSPPTKGSSKEIRNTLLVPQARRGIVEIHFNAPAFRSAGKVRFRYRLLGLSQDWIEAGTVQQASYANLAPGDYSFEVVAANKHGYWGANPARLAFYVEPHWHERTAIRFGAAVLLTVLAVAVIGWRLRAFRKLNRLEKQAARAEERARLAKDLHDSLGSDLTEITLLSNLGERSPPSPEQIARRFEQLSQRTHQALHSLRDLIWTANPRADSLEELASRICDHAERLLLAAGINCRFDLPSQLPELALAPDLRRNLLLAATEAVHNAVRHARPAEVWLRLRVEDAALVIIVEDNGCGFDPLAAGRNKSADHGLGLDSMRQRLESVGGQCLFTSQAGRGTRVTFHVPLSSA